MELKIQFYSMIITEQSKVRLMTLFIAFVGLAQNSGAAQSHGSGAQTDPWARQAAPAQTTNKNVEDVVVVSSSEQEKKTIIKDKPQPTGKEPEI